MNAMTRIAADLFGFVHDRSPRNVPSTAARAIMQGTVVKLRQLGADTKCLSTVALADAIEEAAAGNTEAACEALHAAATLRKMPA